MPNSSGRPDSAPASLTLSEDIGPPGVAVLVLAPQVLSHSTSALIHFDGYQDSRPDHLYHAVYVPANIWLGVLAAKVPFCAAFSGEPLRSHSHHTHPFDKLNARIPIADRHYSLGTTAFYVVHDVRAHEPSGQVLVTAKQLPQHPAHHIKQARRSSGVRLVYETPYPFPEAGESTNLN